jgi:hypothetical protein
MTETRSDGDEKYVCYDDLRSHVDEPSGTTNRLARHLRTNVQRSGTFGGCCDTHLTDSMESSAFASCGVGAFRYSSSTPRVIAIVRTPSYTKRRSHRRGPRVYPDHLRASSLSHNGWCVRGTSTPWRIRQGVHRTSPDSPANQATSKTVTMPSSMCDFPVAGSGTKQAAA